MSFPHPTGMVRDSEACATRCLLSLALAPYVWPGGYERYLVLEDGGLLCRRCAETETETIRDAWIGEDWCPVSVGSADWLADSEPCSHCGETIG